MGGGGIQPTLIGPSSPGQIRAETESTWIKPRRRLGIRKDYWWLTDNKHLHWTHDQSHYFTNYSVVCNDMICINNTYTLYKIEQSLQLQPTLKLCCSQRGKKRQRRHGLICGVSNVAIQTFDNSVKHFPVKQNWTSPLIAYWAFGGHTVRAAVA